MNTFKIITLISISAVALMPAAASKLSSKKSDSYSVCVYIRNPNNIIQRAFISREINNKSFEDQYQSIKRERDWSRITLNNAQVLFQNDEEKPYPISNIVIDKIDFSTGLSPDKVTLRVYDDGGACTLIIESEAPEKFSGLEKNYQEYSINLLDRQTFKNISLLTRAILTEVCNMILNNMKEEASPSLTIITYLTALAETSEVCYSAIIWPE